MERGDRRFYEDDILLADSELFEVLTMDFLRGDPDTALAGPGTLVISRDMATNYFGEEDPMGRP